MKTFLAVAVAAGLIVGAGCGNGHDHSKQDPGNTKAAKAEEKVKDPVCGMMVSEFTAKGHHDYKGGHYNFCSEDCLNKFKASPEKYVK